ncbi:hypothetical protein HDU87_000484 [Geranomyces variabilis]|uniref:Uncharacterized protein n=1 Tax=Geranomyces variabilis TaxID=109894 RepID=A0AAD5XIQ3_9FUNG|nr:hypothetical protein HDU87_000484 [Geranomyces variabilis]
MTEDAEEQRRADETRQERKERKEKKERKRNKERNKEQGDDQGKDKGKKRIAVLHDNPPLPGKKFFLASWISPASRQPHDVYAYKIHDMCEELEEARDLCRYYQGLDKDFDVAIGSVGKWSPWVFDMTAIESAEYADERLTDLVRSHREGNKSDDKRWKENVDKHINEIQHATTREGQEELASRKEPAVSMLFKMKQLELTIKRRREELVAMEEVYHNTYSKEERAKAKKASLPLSEPVPMQYALLSSATEPAAGDEKSKKGETELSIPLSFEKK